MAKYIQSQYDIEGAARLIALGFPKIALYYDELFSFFDGINMMHSDVTREIVLPFTIRSELQIYPEVKRRIANSLNTKDTEVLDIYVWSILRHWKTETLNLFRDELHNIVRIGHIPGEEHDGNAAFLMLSRGMDIDDDVKKPFLN